MWTRRELKERAKITLRSNYWRCVLASLLMALFFTAVSTRSSNNNQSSQYSDNGISIITDDNIDLSNDSFNITINNNPVSIAMNSMPALSGFVAVLVAVAAAAGILLHVFVINPFVVGLHKFFVENAYHPADLEWFAYGFRREHYRNIVKIMFYRNLYLFLWTLCLVIPGFIKSYEYMMIPYILADHPDMEMEEVFAKTKSMMDGEKMNAFVLDLSFLPWSLLGALTWGLVNIFWTFPYRDCTKAELYHTLNIPEEPRETIYADVF